MSKTNTQKEGQSNPAEGKNISSSLLLGKDKDKDKDEDKDKNKVEYLERVCTDIFFLSKFTLASVSKNSTL